jgi:circadian clock protein KaiB
MPKHRFKLFVMGQTPRSQHAIHTLRRICDATMPDDYNLIIVDVLEQPEVAEEHKVIATPTLIKEWPLPARRVLGDLSDKETLLLALDIYPER